MVVIIFQHEHPGFFGPLLCDLVLYLPILDFCSDFCQLSKNDFVRDVKAKVQNLAL